MYVCQCALYRQTLLRRVEQFMRLVFLAESFHRYASQEIWFDSEHYCVRCFVADLLLHKLYLLYLNYT